MFRMRAITSMMYGLIQSVEERRSKFLDWMGLNLDRISRENSVDAPCFDRVMETGDDVLRTIGFEEEFSSVSCWSNGNFDLSGELSPQDNFVSREGNEGASCDVDQVRQDEKASECCESSEVQSVTYQTESPCATPPSIEQFRENEIEKQNKLERIAKKVKDRWLSRLCSIYCMVDTHVEDDRLRLDGDDSILRTRVQRVKVHQSMKKSKELYAVYKGQDIQAYEGSILTMKFSLGQYLASVGQDGVVRVWKVVEDQRCNNLDIPEMEFDPLPPNAFGGILECLMMDLCLSFPGSSPSISNTQ